jgi:diguanylate cyclase
VPAAPAPRDESTRMSALFRAALLDTTSEPFFETIVREVAEFMEAPIALVSLVDEDRQWFKARYNLRASETPREWSFCAYAIHDDIPMIVADAREDERFRENPLVTGEPHIVAYAGAPIILASGARIGTVCAIDQKPRCWRSDELARLQDISFRTARHIDARRGELVHDPQRWMELMILGFSVDEQDGYGAHTAEACFTGKTVASREK